MVQEQATVQERELNNLSKRNQDLYDQYMRIDIECNRVSEELLVASGHLEQMRNECANLRAEKKIWQVSGRVNLQVVYVAYDHATQSVQGRLEEENRILTVERSHLADLMQNVQKMHNDLERSGENDRRRLESQIQMLENQTQDLRAALASEREALRHAKSHKDIDVKELQSRIEKTVSLLSMYRMCRLLLTMVVDGRVC